MSGFGVIAERIGNPDSTPGWRRSCGFYPGSDLSEHQRPGPELRAGARRLRGCVAPLSGQAHGGRLTLPTRVADGRSYCFCGVAIGIADVEPHIEASHLEWR